MGFQFLPFVTALTKGIWWKWCPVTFKARSQMALCLLSGSLLGHWRLGPSCHVERNLSPHGCSGPQSTGITDHWMWVKGHLFWLRPWTSHSRGKIFLLHPVWIPDPPKSWNMNDVWCFKPLRFRKICYTAINNTFIKSTYITNENYRFSCPWTGFH